MVRRGGGWGGVGLSWYLSERDTEEDGRLGLAWIDNLSGIQGRMGLRFWVFFVFGFAVLRVQLFFRCGFLV